MQDHQLGAAQVTAGRRGEIRACQRISSASRLPTPAITDWSSSPGLDRRARATDPLGELGSGHQPGIRTKIIEIRVQAYPAEAPGVEQPQRPAVRVGDHEPIPAGQILAGRRQPVIATVHPVATLGQRSARGGDQDVPAHPQVQTEHRPRRPRSAHAGRLAPDRLAPPERPGQRPSDQCVTDLTGGMRPAHVRVVVVHRR